MIFGNGYYFRICLLSPLLFLFSCDNEIDNFGAYRQVVGTENFFRLLKTYKEGNKMYDSTVLLNYVLGSSKDQVEKHTDSLLSSNILDQKDRYPVIAFNDITRRLDTFKLAELLSNKEALCERPVFATRLSDPRKIQAYLEQSALELEMKN